MNHRTFIGVVALGAAVALTGCAARMDCSEAFEAADAAVLAHRPPGAWMSEVHPDCSNAAMERWRVRLADECAPVFGFHAALTGAVRPDECSSAGFESAWNLGEMIAGMRNEVKEIEHSLAVESLSPEHRRELERRLIVIGRDLPQVEALARMNGYLPPAEVPDSGRTKTRE